MSNQQRAYNEGSDKQWSMAVYHKAKEVISEVLKARDKPVPFAEITEAMKRKHSDLCNDTIGEPGNPKSPYWKHLVASAIQVYKKAGQIQKVTDGWLWIKKSSPKISTEVPPESPEVQDVRQQLKNKLLTLDSKQFENVLGRLLNNLGMEKVRVIGKTADGGVDVEGTMPILNIRIAVQAKKYALQNSVGIDPVQRLIGSVISSGYTRGIFITTSHFTAGARETAEMPDSRIVLIDGEELVDMMMKRGWGIKNVPMVKRALDEEFWSESLRLDTLG